MLTVEPPAAFVAEGHASGNWGPWWDKKGNHLEVVRWLNPVYIASFDPSKATLGARLRYLRRRAKVTIAQLATRSKISHNAISRLERTPDRRANPAILERILQVLGLNFQEVSPGAGDCYDLLVPPKTQGSRIKNTRLKKGLQQKVLAKRLGVSRETVRRWERDLFGPEPMSKTISMRSWDSRYPFQSHGETFLGMASTGPGMRKTPTKSGYLDRS